MHKQNKIKPEMEKAWPLCRDIVSPVKDTMEGSAPTVLGPGCRTAILLVLGPWASRRRRWAPTMTLERPGKAWNVQILSLVPHFLKERTFEKCTLMLCNVQTTCFLFCLVTLERQCMIWFGTVEFKHITALVLTCSVGVIKQGYFEKRGTILE